MSLTPSLITLLKIAFTYLIFKIDITQGNNKIVKLSSAANFLWHFKAQDGLRLCSCNIDQLVAL